MVRLGRVLARVFADVPQGVRVWACVCGRVRAARVCVCVRAWACACVCGLATERVCGRACVGRLAGACRRERAAVRLTTCVLLCVCVCACVFIDVCADVCRRVCRRVVDVCADVCAGAWGAHAWCRRVC